MSDLTSQTDMEQTTPPNECILFRMPPELLLEIRDVLPTSAIAALQLTCTALFHRLGGIRQLSAVNEDDWACGSLPRLLDRDLPDYYSDSLLRKRIDGAYPNTTSDPSAPRYHGTGRELTFMDGVFDYSVQFPHVLLALKRQALGGTHGIPLEAFTYNTTREFEDVERPMHPNPWADAVTTRLMREVEFTTAAKVVNGYLLLQVEYSVKYPERQDTNFNLLQNFPLQICNHVSTIADTSGYKCNRLAILAQSLDLDDPFEWVGNRRRNAVRVGGCQFCPTAFISRRSFKGICPERTVSITAYHNLGTGRCPTDPNNNPHNFFWFHLVGTGNPAEISFIDFYPHIIIRAFEEEDGTELGQISYV